MTFRPPDITDSRSSGQAGQDEAVSLHSKQKKQTIGGGFLLYNDIYWEHGKQRKITQEGFSEQMAVSRQTVAKWRAM